MQRYASFDGLRGFAAIGILLMHYLSNMPPQTGQALRASGSLLYGQVIPFLTALVYMFFILSAVSLCCGYFGNFLVRRVRIGDAKVPVPGFVLDPVSAFLDRYSMKIYLCHMMVFRAIGKLHPECFVRDAQALYWLWCVLGLVGAIAFSWLVTEKVFPALAKAFWTRGTEAAG